jgi:hypothetical protein
MKELSADQIGLYERFIQLQRENKEQPPLAPGEKYTIEGVEYIYTGVNEMAEMLDDLSSFNPAYVNMSAAKQMIQNPLSTVAGVAGAAAGIAGAASNIAGVAGAAFQLNPAITSGLSALGAAGQLGNLTGALSNFLPPGLDAPVEAVKNAIGQVTGQIPGISGPAKEITQKIGQVNALINMAAKGPTSLIFSAIKSNFLADIPGLSDLAGQISLPGEIAQLASAAANPVAFAAKAAGIQANFPMVNVNAIAGDLIKSAAGGAVPNIASMVPNMVKSASGLMKMLPGPGKTPVKDAKAPQKIKKPPKPKEAVEMKNLFAEGAAGSALSTLTQPLSAFMGLMSTIPNMANRVADTPAKTALGSKLNTTANTVNWGSGGYGKNNEFAEQERKRLEYSAKIEKNTAELLEMVDYSKLTQYSYQDLIKKYPRITGTMTVAEALTIIEEDDAKAATTV